MNEATHNHPTHGGEQTTQSITIEDVDPIQLGYILDPESHSMALSNADGGIGQGVVQEQFEDEVSCCQQI